MKKTFEQRNFPGQRPACWFSIIPHLDVCESSIRFMMLIFMTCRLAIGKDSRFQAKRTGPGIKTGGYPTQ